MRTPNSQQIPFQDKVTDVQGLVSNAWQQVFVKLYEIFQYLGDEKSFQLGDNVELLEPVVGMLFDSRYESQAEVEYLIQRKNETNLLVETGKFLVSYRPSDDYWQKTSISQDLPDDSGVDLYFADKIRVATYSHVTQLWTAAGYLLPANAKVKVSSSGTLPTGYSSASFYYVVNQTASTFQLSSTPSGLPVVANVNSGTGTLTVTNQSPTIGQIYYKSSVLDGVLELSRINWRSRKISAKSNLYSKPRSGPLT